MGEKDPGEKLLEDYEDVFADIINVLAFHGERLLCEENIVSGPTASIYKDENQDLREQIRDIIKFDKQENSIFSVIGLENQSTADPDMVFRVMGYDYASYRAQIDKKEKLRYQKFLPDLITDFKINVVEVAYLPKEVREQFTSDFGIIADYFCNMREGRDMELLEDSRSFHHVEAMLEFFRVFSGDQRYQELKKPIMEQAKKGALVSMCSVLDYAINKGEIKGKIEAYCGLIEDGLLTIEQAASKMGLSDSEFLERAKELHLNEI